MLGLPQQIGGADFRIYCLVRDDHCFGRAGKQINAHAAEKLALGLCDIGVSRPNKHVYRIDGFRAQSHSANGLNPAQTQDFMRPAKMHRGNNRRVRAPIHRRRRGDNARHARNRSGENRHMR